MIETDFRLTVNNGNLKNIFAFNETMTFDFKGTYDPENPS